MRSWGRRERLVVRRSREDRRGVILARMVRPAGLGFHGRRPVFMNEGFRTAPRRASGDGTRVAEILPWAAWGASSGRHSGCPRVVIGEVRRLWRGVRFCMGGPR